MTELNAAMQPYTVELTAGVEAESPAVAVTLSELRFLVFQGMQGERGETGPRGYPGEPGRAPFIGQNGNWWFWDENLPGFADTNIPARGPKGDRGDPGLPAVTALDDGKVLGVVDGAWAAYDMETAEEAYDIDYLGFEVGALTTGKGAIYGAKNRIVSSRQIKLSDYVAYSANANWYNKYAFYDAGRSYLGTGADIGWTKTFFTIDMAPEGAAYMRIIAYRSGTQSTDVYTEADLIEANPVVTMKRRIFPDADGAVNRYRHTGYELVAYSSVGAAPINTMEHFEYCAARQYDLLKCDVQPTSDGKLILCHDKGFTLDGNGKITTYDASSQVLIHEITAAQATAYVHAAQYQGQDCQVIDLDAYLRFCKKRALVPYITVRNEYISEVVSALSAALLKYGFQNRCIVNSSAQDTLAAVREAIPGATLCLFCDPFSELASAYQFASSNDDTILSYFYTQGGRTWADFLADSAIQSCITRCNQNGLQQIAGIESDLTHRDALIALGFDGCHLMNANQPAKLKTTDDLPVYSGGVH